ncbi:DUF1772 domain-containing protein [Aspergillus mulundensis]|uniref:DUF1772-domain-containing protein n=1 Tax=Aspergillus mulundensis TaxID=1810919 RepID=A0A3D8S6E0_9EURO|nr:Uncharacterized protein DSM5745_05131 [Aspergillus mulundensis]RDW81574.1 Uncharacterized protein DSM5745_05131 [Aspergillus mulundensis]
MSQYPTPVRLAQALGLTGAAYLAGNIFAYSYATIPALQASAAKHSAPAPLLAKQWSELYARGKAQNPPIAAITAAAFAYLAWTAHSGKSAALDVLAPRNAVALYSAAAALTVGIVPWTFAAMKGTNDKLHERASEVYAVTEKTGQEVGELLSRWKVLNAVRGLFPLVGGLVGFLAF